MNSKLWIRKALSLCLVIAVNATYSMVALANTKKIAGELTVTGKSLNSAVMVNGEAAKSGRSVFSASTIATPADTIAIINLGKVGKLELAPNTVLTLSFDNEAAFGELSAGKVTVLGTESGVNIKTSGAEAVTVGAGESVTAGKAQDDDDDDDGGSAWWAWALIFGGAAAGILWAATQADNRTSLGGGGTVVSPVQ